MLFNLLYTVPLSAVNGLSHMTKLTTSKGAGTADSIQKFSNRPIPVESNRMADSNSNRISKLSRSLCYTAVKVYHKHQNKDHSDITQLSTASHRLHESLSAKVIAAHCFTTCTLLLRQ